MPDNSTPSASNSPGVNISGAKTAKPDPVQQAIDSVGSAVVPLIPTDPTQIVGAVGSAVGGNLQPIGAIGSPIISTGIHAGGDAAATAIGTAIGGPFGGLIGGIIEKTGGKLVHSFALDNLVHVFNAHISDIAVDMQAQGWVIGKHSEKEISRDAQFRLWRKVFSFPGGGHLADLLRDSQEAKVWAIVDPQFDTTDPNKPLNLADLVTAVAKATLEVTF